MLPDWAARIGKRIGASHLAVLGILLLDRG
jgi:hypothetical protein